MKVWERQSAGLGPATLQCYRALKGSVEEMTSQRDLAVLLSCAENNQGPEVANSGHPMYVDKTSKVLPAHRCHSKAYLSWNHIVGHVPDPESKLRSVGHGHTFGFGCH